LTTDPKTIQTLESLASAVRSISHGDVHGPTGLEMLTMAICGDGSFGHDSVVQAIRDAGQSIENGLRAVASAITEESAR
jgi:hypothetical protein